MNSYANQRNQNGIWTIILLGIIVLYQLQGIAYPQGMINKGIALVELAICGVFLIQTIFSENVSKIAKSLLALIVVVLISYAVSDKIIHGVALETANTFGFFRGFCGAVLPFYAFYCLSRKGEININIIKTFFVISFIISLIIFVQTMATLEPEDLENTTINASYRFVALLPFLGLFRKRWGYVFLTISFLVALVSAKRGAILCVSAVLLVYSVFNVRNSKHPVRDFILTIAFFGLLAVAVRHIYLNSPYLQYKAENTLEGNSSGRDIIFSKLWNYYKDNTEAQQFLFGYGFCSTVNIAGKYAHNDWVELLIDTGLVGFVCMAVFVVMLCGTYRRNRPDSMTRLLIIVAFTLPTFFSMVIFSESTSSIFILLGYLLGNEEFLAEHYPYAMTATTSR